MSEVIPHWLTKQAYLAPHRPAIETVDGEIITFLQLKKKSQRLAKKLAQTGVKTGDHIGVLSTNQTSMIITIHALSYLGAVCVLLNRRLTAKELSYQINDAHVSLILTCDDMAHDVQQMNFSVRSLSYSEMIQCKEKQVNLATEIKMTDMFTIIYTSGTTGFPKGVVHTYGNHWWSAISSSLNLGLHANDKWLLTLPMFHVGGLSILMKSVIYGMPIFLLDKFDAPIVNQVIKDRDITIASVVTTMLQQILHELKEQHYPDHFRCMLLGGGSAPVSLLEQAKQHRIPVFQSYGLTETSSQIVTLGPEDTFKKIGSSGKPLFPGQLKIHQPGKDFVGEIYVKGPMVTKGYYQSDDANKELFKDNWLATGDLGMLDDEGYLYVVDRRTDLIISGGENIYPTEVEDVLMQIDEIKEVGVVGVKDSNWGQVPVAFVVKRNKHLPAEAIIKYAKDHLANYKVPKMIYFLDELPRNASQKLMRHKLLKMLNESFGTERGRKNEWK